MWALADTDLALRSKEPSRKREIIIVKVLNPRQKVLFEHRMLDSKSRVVTVYIRSDQEKVQSHQWSLQCFAFLGGGILLLVVWFWKKVGINQDKNEKESWRMMNLFYRDEIERYSSTKLVSDVVARDCQTREGKYSSGHRQCFECLRFEQCCSSHSHSLSREANNLATRMACMHAWW